MLPRAVLTGCCQIPHFSSLHRKRASKFPHLASIEWDSNPDPCTPEAPGFSLQAALPDLTWVPPAESGATAPPLLPGLRASFLLYERDVTGRGRAVAASEQERLGAPGAEITRVMIYNGQGCVIFGAKSYPVHCLSIFAFLRLGGLGKAAFAVIFLEALIPSEKRNGLCLLKLKCSAGSAEGRREEGRERRQGGRGPGAKDGQWQQQSTGGWWAPPQSELTGSRRPLHLGSQDMDTGTLTPFINPTGTGSAGS